MPAFGLELPCCLTGLPLSKPVAAAAIPPPANAITTAITTTFTRRDSHVRTPAAA